MLVYNIQLPETEDGGMDAISLVELPAVERDFLVFNSQKERKMLFQDAEKHIITGIAILADTPIYRLDEDGTEYYVVFSKDTIRALVEKYFKDNLANVVNIEHNENEYVSDLVMIESYIVDKQRKICPIEFEDVPDGSWIVSYKVLNEDVWQKVKSGEIKGFSIQGLFDIVRKFNKKNIKKNKMNRFKEALKNLIMKYNDVMTDKGELEWEEDAQLEVGYKVYQNDMPAPDGDYTLPDGTVFVVANGEVTEIRKPETEDEMKKREKCAEEDPTEDPAEEPAEEPVEEPDEMSEIKSRISELETKLEELIAKVAELAAIPAPSVESEFSAITNPKNIDIKLKRAIDIASNLK